MTPAAAPGEDDVAFAGVAGQAAMLADGTLTSRALVDLLLSRIERLQPSLNAFRVVLAGEARRAADVADAARTSGDTRPLLGVPVAIKDNVHVAGQSAMFGTGSPEPEQGVDDVLVQRLRDAGMVIIGLTHLPELALWAATESRHHGVTRNPWDTSFAPGGSSGGSAAAVAAGLVPAAHGTDGLGSIRIPSSSCGLVGLKPTHGLVPLGPDPHHWQDLSHAGFLTRTVVDTATLLDTVIDPSPGFAAGLDDIPRALRIAASTKTVTPMKVDPQVRRAFDAALETLRGLGHTVVERDPEYGAVLANANSVRYLSGVATDVSRLADPTATEGRTRTLARMGRLLPGRTVRWARRRGDGLRADMTDRFFADVDVLVTPTMPVLPVRAGSIVGKGLPATLGAMVPRAAYTSPWNGCGLPALSAPVAVTDGGLPVGIQLVGPPGADGLLLRLARQLEVAVDWPSRHPPLPTT